MVRPWGIEPQPKEPESSILSIKLRARTCSAKVQLLLLTLIDSNKGIEMKAYLFPGQGAQFPGMGKDLYESSAAARAIFDEAREILGFDIVEIMFDGSDEQLRETSVTQPSIFIHSVAAARALDDFAPDMVAGHSLGEFSALVAAGALEFEDALRLVAARANAMNEACKMNPGKMAAVILLDLEIVKKICAQTEGIVVAANVNAPGQIVISGDADAVDQACKACKAAGAKRAAGASRTWTC